MTCCCRRNVDGELLLQEERRPRKNFWQGRVVDFYCWGGQDGQGTAAVLYTLAMAITALASITLTYAFTTSPNTVVGDAFLMVPVCALMFCGIPGCFAMDVGNHRCSRPRKWPSPAIASTAALVAASVYILIKRENAQGELIRYYENQTWAAKLRQDIQNDCSEIVLESAEEMTSKACIVCNSKEQPFQSLLSGDVGVSISDCLAPFNGSTITISMNESIPGRDYLCGVSVSTDEDSSWQTKECVVNYLEENYCLYPPLVATFDDFYATVSATIHIDLLKRCEKDPKQNACSPYYNQCETPEAAAYFKEVRNLYEIIKNATLPYPEDADNYLKLTDPVTVPLTSTTVGVTASAFLYEAIALRKYMLSVNPA